LRDILSDPQSLLWVDFQAAPLVEIEPHSRDMFGFHVLARDDALREIHVPKIDDWGNYLYAVVHGVIFDQKSLALTTRELNIFLGRNYLVTYHHQSIDAVERVWRHICQDHRRLAHGPAYLLYLLLDTLTANYLPTIDALDATLDTLETTVLTRPAPQSLSTIFRRQTCCLASAAHHWPAARSPQQAGTRRL
jgi:magnesium transporter